jgi:RNA polymerase sigma-70 factor (ECF subfamily)
MTDSSAPIIPDASLSQAQAPAPVGVGSEDRFPIRNLSELTEFFESVRPRLEKIVRFRLDPAFRARIDESDVLQEAFLQIAKRHQELLDTPELHPMVWIRQRVLQTLWDMQRNHGRDKRSVHRENEIPMASSNTTSITMARWLADDVTSPSQRMIKDEEQQRLQSALESMNEIDREILAIRHFEYLTNLQTAQALGISPTAASNRYVRAAIRLAEILQNTSLHESSEHESTDLGGSD